MNIQLNIVTCLTYPEKSIRDNVVAPFVPTSVVIVTLPFAVGRSLLLLRASGTVCHYTSLQHHISLDFLYIAEAQVDFVQQQFPIMISRSLSAILFLA